MAMRKRMNEAPVGSAEIYSRMLVKLSTMSDEKARGFIENCANIDQSKKYV